MGSIIEQNQNIYELGQFMLNPAEHFMNNVFETLVVLLQRRPHLADKSERIKIIWEDASTRNVFPPIPLNVSKGARGGSN